MAGTIIRPRFRFRTAAIRFAACPPRARGSRVRSDLFRAPFRPPACVRAHEFGSTARAACRLEHANRRAACRLDSVKQRAAGRLGSVKDLAAWLSVGLALAVTLATLPLIWTPLRLQPYLSLVHADWYLDVLGAQL